MIVLKDSMLSCVIAICNDIKKWSPDVTKSELEAGTLAALQMLHELGAAHPNVYIGNDSDSPSQSNWPVVAFQAATKKIASLRVEARRHEEETSSVWEPVSIGEDALELLDKYDRLKEEFGAVDGYIQLLRSTPNLTGYAYFLASFKIPVDNMIYDNDKVIQAHNDHGVLGRDRQRTKSAGNLLFA